MKLPGGLCVTFLLAGGLLAQQRNFVNPTPVVTGGFGNVVYPGGTPATVPGLQRFNTFVSPLGGPRLVVPNATQQNHQRRANTGVIGYPLYVGGYDYSGYAGYGQPVEQPQQQPNVTVIYPPQPAPVIINQFGTPDPNAGAQPRMYQVPQDTAPAPEAATVEPNHYLIAFKDHTIYSAVAYWVDGDTLHYFTSGNTHNQASLSLVDRDLTLRLNRESGVDIKIPTVK